MTTKTKWIVVIATVLLWAIGCCSYCYWYATSILAEPVWDAYANSVGFQVFTFSIVRLPCLLFALFPILYIEGLICEFFIEKKKFV